ncbi:MAG: tripartite tricarboxylate transporter substrate binding protein [Betaproteobacteria bacterium]|nr:tripartite tricarboxylate transporter substrate binding protein [Betaproteobacteria bacterium]
MDNSTRVVLSAAVAVMVGVLALPANAQNWPVRPIRLVVNFPAGGTTDLMARAFAPRLAETLGQPVVIDNRGGAAGNIGLELVTKAAPDGYTILASSGSPIVVGPHIYKLNVNVDRDLAPVTPLARILTLLVVRPGIPVKSVAELTAYLRAHPNKLNYGSVGTGSTLHIHAERYLFANKLKATHVPYKGAALMVTALIGDQVDFAFDSGLSIPHVKSGKLRALAVAAAARSPLFPDIPTMAETGTEVNDALFGVYVPAGTPREIVLRLNRDIGRIMQTPEARAALAAFGAEVVTLSPDEFTEVQRRDRERYGTFIRAANIRAD